MFDMTVKDLIKAGFTNEDAIKGSGRYKDLIAFLDAKKVDVILMAGLLLDLQYYKLSENEWQQVMKDREPYVQEEKAKEMFE